LQKKSPVRIKLLLLRLGARSICIMLPFAISSAGNIDSAVMRVYAGFRPGFFKVGARRELAAKLNDPRAHRDPRFKVPDLQAGWRTRLQINRCWWSIRFSVPVIFAECCYFLSTTTTSLQF
jgi:hypothetical protein